jgi:hypothetical protein
MPLSTTLSDLKGGNSRLAQPPFSSLCSARGLAPPHRSHLAGTVWAFRGGGREGRGTEAIRGVRMAWISWGEFPKRGDERQRRSHPRSGNLLPLAASARSGCPPVMPFRMGLGVKVAKIAFQKKSPPAVCVLQPTPVPMPWHAIAHGPMPWRARRLGTSALGAWWPVSVRVRKFPFGEGGGGWPFTAVFYANSLSMLHARARARTQPALPCHRAGLRLGGLGTGYIYDVLPIGLIGVFV